MLTTGSNLGLLDNGNYGEQSYAELLRLFRGLDVLVQPHVKSASLAIPPELPTEGDAYIVPVGATGDWLEHDGHIARWSARSALPIPEWEFFTPKVNWKCGVDDLGTDGQCLRFNGTEWVGNDIVISPDAPDDNDGRPNGTIYFQVAP